MPDQGFLYGKTISLGNNYIKHGNSIHETQPLSPRWRLKGKHVFTSLFQMLANESEALKLLKWLSKATY